MLSLQLRDLAVRLGIDVNILQSLTGDLSQLSGSEKTDLVSALNQLKEYADSYLDGTIDDSRQAADRAYSSNKIVATIAAAIDLIKLGAPEAYDSLKEIADWISNDQSNTADALIKIEKTLRFDVSAELTQQSKNNVGTTLNINQPLIDINRIYNSFFVPDDPWEAEDDPFVAVVSADVRFDADGQIDRRGTSMSALLAPAGEAIAYNDAIGRNVFRTTGGKYLQLNYNSDLNPNIENTIEIWFVRRSMPETTMCLFSQDYYGVNFDRGLSINGLRPHELRLTYAAGNLHMYRNVPDNLFVDNIGTLEKISLYRRADGTNGIAYNDIPILPEQKFNYSNSNNPITFGVFSWNRPGSHMDMDIARIRITPRCRF